MFVFLDTPFDREFPIYTRANAGEILPHPLTPLAWSTIGRGLEEGFRITFCDDLGIFARPNAATSFLMVGRAATRFHLNLSVLRTAGSRLPGTSADVVDVQYFGDATANGLPPHGTNTDDRRFRIKAPPVMGRTVAGIGRRVDRDRAAVDVFGGGVDSLLARGGDDAELVRMVREGGALFARLMGTHVTARALTSPLLEQATNALARHGVEPHDALRYVSAIPGLESAKPSRALADIAATVAPGSPLAELVDGGSLDAIAASDLPGAAELHRAVVEFVAEFGHRGVGEFDPTIPVWEQRPDDVVRLLASMGSHAAVTPDAPDVDPGRMARPLVAAARSAMFRAERTKDNCMRSTNCMRRLLFALADRWADRVDLDLLRMCTLDEIEAWANGAGSPYEPELERRRAEFDVAAALAVAEWSQGSLRLADAAAPEADASDTDPIEGIAGSPGIAIGVARVMEDPYGDFEDGDVLIATMTDTAWTPLFVSASAVVTDVGGVLSHATIVARDLGIPAVVNTKIGTGRIRTGDTVKVDGTAGTVEIVTRTS